MRELPTILLFVAFLGLCALLFFVTDSKDYEDVSKMPLEDDDMKDKFDAENKED